MPISNVPSVFNANNAENIEDPLTDLYTNTIHAFFQVYDKQKLAEARVEFEQINNNFLLIACLCIKFFRPSVYRYYESRMRYVVEMFITHHDQLLLLPELPEDLFLVDMDERLSLLATLSDAVNESNVLLESIKQRGRSSIRSIAYIALSFLAEYTNTSLNYYFSNSTVVLISRAIRWISCAYLGINQISYVRLQVLSVQKDISMVGTTFKLFC